MLVAPKVRFTLVVVVAFCVGLLAPHAAGAWERPAVFGSMPGAGAPRDALLGASRVGAATARLVQAPAPDGRRTPVSGPGSSLFDPATRTVYVVSNDGDIVVIDGRRATLAAAVAVRARSWRRFPALGTE